MKKILLIIGIAAALPVMAELTTEDTVSKDYLKNHGYSQSTINAIQKSRAQANGEALSEPVEKEYYNQPVVKFVRRLVEYIDPTLDDHSFMNDHDIKTSPSYEDL